VGEDHHVRGVVDTGHVGTTGDDDAHVSIIDIRSCLLDPSHHLGSRRQVDAKRRRTSTQPVDVISEGKRTATVAG
jgi:hypothetical protein